MSKNRRGNKCCNNNTPPRNLFSYFGRESRIRFSKIYADWTYKVLTVEGQNINSRYNTDQGRVLISWQNFTILDRTPNQGYRWFTIESSSPQQSTVLTEKVGSLKRPLQIFQTNIFFKISKQSSWILILEIMSDLQSETFDIENKCSTICVCKIVLQSFYIRIQKIEL